MKNSNEKDACQPWVKVYRVVHVLPATSTPTCGATPTSEAEAAKRREDVIYRSNYPGHFGGQ
uniref:Uncharacterized protein n=2 Tax=Oryza TaxID=4527 RepID=A0A0D3FWL2_9ORYZ